ncbi:MAG: class I SAM-dependent methyltransferase [Gammaproteobacteria bacterium]
MKNRASGFTAVALALIAGIAQAQQGVRASLDEVVAGSHRSEANRARDVHRHPVQTLEFFGVQPDMTVVEVSPGAGWYTEILGPLLRERGRLYLAGAPLSRPDIPEYARRMQGALNERIKAEPQSFGSVVVTELDPARGVPIAPAGSADVVLTFRNVHNWIKAGTAQQVFDTMAAALKPGGVLGVVEHRARPSATTEEMGRSGYVTEEQVIAYATAAGLRLDARSEINANPRDTRDWPDGVWTLPPSLRLGDKDREKYLAIGESDRMTLRFVKPR